MTGDFNVAVHALVLLAHRGTPLPSDALAQSICTNPARVRKVMARLCAAGLVKAREGRDGGYHLERPAQDVSLADVARALDTRFVSCSWSSGDVDMNCVVASGMASTMEQVYDELDALCLERLENKTIAQLEAGLRDVG